MIYNITCNKRANDMAQWVKALAIKTWQPELASHRDGRREPTLQSFPLAFTCLVTSAYTKKK